MLTRFNSRPVLGILFNINFFGEVRQRYLSSNLHLPTQSVLWLRGLDLNQRPLAYEANELPTAPPRDILVVT